MPCPAQDITDTELEILKLLWKEGPLTTRAITDELYPDGAQSHYATVQSLLSRLEEKALVDSDRGARPHVFRAAVRQDVVIGRRLRALADTLCDGSRARSSPTSSARASGARGNGPSSARSSRSSTQAQKPGGIQRRARRLEMFTLLEVGLGNAAQAGFLALAVAAVSLAVRHPALLHALWIIVLLRAADPAHRSGAAAMARCSSPRHGRV